ncbi:MAG TPA: TraR/DksA C4-type zinc finger protein [Solirubrobacteraceae bacterium]|nr:TraR/DksA C4-type zinc finger protein [Solirubrobacteraceae bacterium]
MATSSTGPVDLAAAERELRASKEQIERRLGRFTERPERGTNLSFGKRIGDGTTEAIERLTTIGVGTQLESRLEKVDRALVKLDEGTYGTCDVCGDPIDPRRLERYPESTVCTNCPFSHR